MRKVIVLSFMFSLLLLFSCNNGKRKLKVDLSDVEKVDIKIKRYEKALFEMDQNDLKNELKKLDKEYKMFIQGAYDNEMSLIQMQDYLNDTMIAGIYRDCIKKYPDLYKIENELSQAFRYYKYYFSHVKTPKIYTYISGILYEKPISFEDSVLIIALDTYLGNDYRYYSVYRIPAYRSIRMTQDYIVSDCVMGIALRKIKYPVKSKTLLDRMMYEGKLLYFTDAMLPETADEYKIGYTKEQIDWCRRNEANIWSFFVKNDLLYSMDSQVKKKFLNDGPFTGAISKVAPARLGSWLGWQIIKKYMNNSDVTIQELIHEDNTQKILKESKYKPKK